MNPLLLRLSPSVFVLTCRWQTGCTPAPRRHWAPGPPESVSGPGIAGGSWMLWQIHESPPGWPRPPRWGRSAGLQYTTHKNQFISLLFPCCLAHFPEWMKQTSRHTQSWSSLNNLCCGSQLIISLCPCAVNCMYETCLEEWIHLRYECRRVMALTCKCKFLISHTAAIWKKPLRYRAC